MRNANKEIKADQLQKIIKIDGEVELKELSIKLYDDLRKLEPYGMGNPKPIFTISNVEIIDKRVVGKEEKHFSINFKKNSVEIKAIFFGGNLHNQSLELNKKYDIVFSLDLDTWQGNNELKLNVVDIKQAKPIG